jgi:hypothetical protein
MARFVSSGVYLITTNNTVVFQNPNANFLVISLYASTPQTLAANCDILISGSRGNTYITKTNQVGAGESVDFISNRLVLISGQTLQARSSLASGLDIFASLYEVNS